MRTEKFSTKPILALLRRRKIATLPEIMREIGTTGLRTAFRKLREIDYRVSYSHRGKYYSLPEVMRFDAAGLWSHESVWFSLMGTLLDTAKAAVTASDGGYLVDELDNLLHVGTKDPLRKLVMDGCLSREKFEGQFLYCSSDRKEQRMQLLFRRTNRATPGVQGALPHVEIMPDELKAAIILFFSVLNECQRRLYAGLESLKSGHGGDRLIANLFGIDAETVARGRRELLAGDVSKDRVRQAGAGRKPLEKKRPI
jgi:hypothetical protein